MMVAWGARCVNIITWHMVRHGVAPLAPGPAREGEAMRLQHGPAGGIQNTVQGMASRARRPVWMQVHSRIRDRDCVSDELTFTPASPIFRGSPMGRLKGTGPMPVAVQTLHEVAFRANVATVAVAIDFAALPDASQQFIVEYGLRQYVQDGAAVSKQVKDGEVMRDRTADEIADLKREGVEERIANLLAGEFTRRGAAVKLTPEEKERNAIIMDGLANIAKSVGKALPTRTGKKANPELLDQMVAAYYAKNQADVDKEVARRAKVNVPVDVTDLIAMLG